ncbi:MAG: ABC transporter permease [Oxalobacteraceae bacterium]
MPRISLISRILMVRCLFASALVMLLQIACELRWITPQVMVSPLIMASTLWQLLTQGTITADLSATVSSALQALLLAVVLGVTGGALMHRYHRLRNVLLPVVSSWYAVPVFAFYPMLIALLGLNQRPVVAIGTLFAVVAMAVNTLDGLDRLPASLLKSARLMQLSRAHTIFRLVLPAVLPALMTGFKLAATYAFIGVIAAEFILSTHGLGHAIAYAYNDFDMRTMYALMLLVLMFSGSVQLGLLVTERRLLRHRSTLGGE